MTAAATGYLLATGGALAAHARPTAPPPPAHPGVHCDIMSGTSALVALFGGDAAAALQANFEGVFERIAGWSFAESPTTTRLLIRAKRLMGPSTQLAFVHWFVGGPSSPVGVAPAPAACSAATGAAAAAGAIQFIVF